MMAVKKFEEEGLVKQHVALHRQVLVIASTRVENTWKAHCHVVEGLNHDREAEEAYEGGLGAPMAERHARALFPRPPFSGLKYAQ